MFSIDATFIFIFISFLIFINLMKYLCYKPLLKVIEEREKFYEKNQKTVLETNSKTENIIKEIEGEISCAKFESSKMLKEAMDNNNKEKAEFIQNKKNEIRNSIENFENGLQESSNLAKEQLKGEIKEYVKETVSKALKVAPNEVEVENLDIEGVLK